MRHRESREILAVVIVVLSREKRYLVRTRNNCYSLKKSSQRNFTKRINARSRSRTSSRTRRDARIRESRRSSASYSELVKSRRVLLSIFLRLPFRDPTTARPVITTSLHEPHQSSLRPLCRRAGERETEGGEREKVRGKERRNRKKSWRAAKTTRRERA